jgi:hypothetical protein
LTGRFALSVSNVAESELQAVIVSQLLRDSEFDPGRCPRSPLHKPTEEERKGGGERGGQRDDCSHELWCQSAFIS